MRTTLAVDDDVLMAVRERARREGRSAGQVLSELARQALTGQHRTQASAETALGRHGFTPLPHRGPAVSTALVEQLLEEGGE